MRVELFDFELPPEHIAEHPAEQRDQARMLHVMQEGLVDRRIGDLPERISSGDVLVLNNTRVIPARLHGRRGEVAIEILLHKQCSDGTWSSFARPAKRLKPGQTIRFTSDFSAEVIGKQADGQVILTFNKTGDAFHQALEEHGEMPLPPYISRPQGAQQQDREDYQTCYAQREGSVAAPTAGLHFTPQMLERLEAKGVEIVCLTLHVGGGTFLPVKAEDTQEHVMHSEWGEITEEVAGRINAAKGDVIAVGTTSLRLLESACDAQGVVHPFCAETDIFITPGYRFRRVNRLLTNFHLPKSTLFMLVCAFAGMERMKAAYAHAIEQGYRFYSYGDACLLECCDGA